MSYLTVLDLFAGAGGFSVAAHALTGEANVHGIELDEDAVDTQHAAGMGCEQTDITTLDPNNYADQPSYRAALGDHLHIHASPPCQSFSGAGKGDGRKHLDTLGSAAYDILLRGITYVDLSEVPEGSLLVLEPARWIHALRPNSISMEQVRSVLPIWESFAEGLQALGYHTWTKLLHSEQYGVPQTRVRAWLGASLHHPVEPPTPTHSKYHVRKPAKLDAGIPKWVSMAEALGWEDDDLAGFPRRADRGAATTIGGVEYRARDFRQGDQPAFGLTEKARSWTHLLQGGAGGEGRPQPADQPAPTQSAKGTATVTNDPDNHWHDKENKAAREYWRQSDQERATTRSTDLPAGTIAFGHAADDMRFTDDATDIGYQRKDDDSPATTVQGDSRIWPRGHKINQADIDRLGEAEAKARYGDRAGSKARRVTVAEAAALQGFPADFPFQGSKTSQFRQVGNAVNPAVAAAVLGSVL